MEVQFNVVLVLIFCFHSVASDGNIDIAEPSTQFVTQDIFQTVINGIKEAFDRRMNSTVAELQQAIAEIENLKLLNLACSEEMSCLKVKFGNSSESNVSEQLPESLERKGKLDIIFVLDGSGSVQWNFNDIITWTQRMAGKFDVESGLIQIGVVQFSGKTGHNPLEFITTEIALGSITSNSRLQRAIGEITRRGTLTYTAAALLKTLSDFQNAPRWTDRDTKKVIVLLTDGSSTDSYHLDEAAKRVRSQGIIPFAVGVGSFNKRELQVIATGDNSSDERIFTMESFDGLDGIVTKLSDLIFRSN